jgi:hypothetical protein
LYHQDIPKPVDDSDEEVSAEPKKRWKYNAKCTEGPNGNGYCRNRSTLETMVSRREKVAVDGTKISSRYEGVPEHNSSRYSLFLPMPANAHAKSRYGRQDELWIQMMIATATMAIRTTILIRSKCALLPPTTRRVVNFAQPASRQTLKASPRPNIIRRPTAGIRVICPNGDAVGPGDKSGQTSTGGFMLRVFPVPKPVNNSGNRLLNKLKGVSANGGGGG